MMVHKRGYGCNYQLILLLWCDEYSDEFDYVPLVRLDADKVKVRIE